MIDFEAGKTFLTARGINLCAVFDCATLPGDAIRPMAATGINPADFRRLVLLGNGGSGFWSSLEAFGFHTDDPVDHYARHLTRRLLHEFLDDPPSLLLYPGGAAAPSLTRLGELAGWGSPSPVFVGIHPDYGPWFAYRAAFLVDLDLPVDDVAPRPHPCDACLDKPCLSACPVGAARWPGPSDIDACARSRIEDGSPCADRCLARLACPVGAEHRYSLAQIRYHYLHSLPTIRSYYATQSERSL